MQTTLTDNVATSILPYLPQDLKPISLTIAWPSFVSGDGSSITAGKVTIALTGGTFSYTLESNVGAVPSLFYTFTFLLADSYSGKLELYSAQVVVPYSVTPIAFEDCTILAPWLTRQGTGGGDTTTPPPQAPYKFPVPAPLGFIQIPATQHGKGQTALPCAFSDDVPAMAVTFNYSRASNGDLQLSFQPPFAGIIEIWGGAQPGKTLPYLAPLSIASNEIRTIPANAHGQGPMPIMFGFTNDPVPVAVALEYSRNSAGDITIPAELSFSGFVQIVSGHNSFIVPCYLEQVAVVPQSLHQRGSAARAYLFNETASAFQEQGFYTRALNGDLAFSFNPPFSGIIQIIEPS